MNGQGKTWWDEANTFYQKFYALLGAHADYDFGPVVVSLWGRNLTDTRYNTFAVQSSAAGGTHYFAQRRWHTLLCTAREPLTGRD